MNNNLPKSLPGLPTRVLRLERCEKCKWRGDPGQPNQYECREGPPTATTHMVFPQGPNRPPQFVTHTGFPVVNRDGWCGRWKPRIEGVN